MLKTPVSNPGNAQFAIYEEYTSEHHGEYRHQTRGWMKVYHRTLNIRVIDLIAGHTIASITLRPEMHDKYDIPDSYTFPTYTVSEEFSAEHIGPLASEMLERLNK